MSPLSRLDPARKALDAKQRELSDALRRRYDIHIERVPDPVDDSGLAVEREATMQRRDRDWRLLREVEAALDRLNRGEYGLCVRCGGAIGPPRLKAVPWAANCIPCQDALERAQSSFESEQTDLTEHAA